MDESRLIRIEDKVDKLSEAVISLARMEERMITLFNRMDSYESTQTKLQDRVTDVEKVTASRGAIFRLVDKLVWIVIGIVVALGIEALTR